MPAARKKEISLLPESENANSLVSRAIKWLLTVGRVIIIVTELLVISAFASRFWLDRRNSDISDTIRQQKAILESVQDFEKEYSSLQKKLKVIKDIYGSQPDYVSYVNSLIESTPPGITYKNLDMGLDENNKMGASIIVIAYKEDPIISFITNLVLNPDLEQVEVRTIEKKPKETQYQVNLSLNFKPKSNAATK